MGGWHIEKRFNREGNISAVVEHVLVGNFSIGKVFKETLVFINSHLTFGTVPNRTERVDHLSVELDWVRNKLRELLDCLLNKAIS